MKYLLSLFILSASFKIDHIPPQATSTLQLPVTIDNSEKHHPSSITATYKPEWINAFSPTDSFDVFFYHTPEFFTKTVLPSQVQFSMKNNDTSFCLITIYKSQASSEDLSKSRMAQWNEYVVKRLQKASRKPLQVLAEKQWDGWNSALSVGNFYQNKKKCVVMLYTFQTKNITACAVYALSDKLFKGQVELFSQNLHLK